MIRLLAELKCKRHPKYKGLRQPASCWTCTRIWEIMHTLRRVSRRFSIQYSDKVWPRLSEGNVRQP